MQIDDGINLDLSNNGVLHLNGGMVYAPKKFSIKGNMNFIMDNPNDYLFVGEELNVQGYSNIYDNNTGEWKEVIENPLCISDGIIWVRQNAMIFLREENPVVIKAGNFIIEGDDSLYNDSEEFYYPYYGALIVQGAIIDKLTLWYEADKYNISPVPCWNTLIIDEDSNGENGEGSNGNGER